MTDEHYHLEYHRAMEAAYRRQNPMPLIPIAVNSSDHFKFLELCRQRNMTVAAMFHHLITNERIQSNTGIVPDEGKAQ